MADTDEAAAIWSRAKALLLSNNSLSERYKSCISEIKPFRCFDNMIILEATNEFTRITIENNISKDVLQALKLAAGKDMTFLIHLVPAPGAGATGPTPADDPNDAIAIASQAHQRNAMPTPATMARQTAQPSMRPGMQQGVGQGMPQNPAQHPGHHSQRQQRDPRQGTLFDQDAFNQANQAGQANPAAQQSQATSQGAQSAQASGTAPGTNAPNINAPAANANAANPQGFETNGATYTGADTYGNGYGPAYSAPAAPTVPGTDPYGTNPYDDYAAYPQAPSMPAAPGYATNQGAPQQGTAQPGVPARPRPMPAPRKTVQMGPAAPASYAPGYAQRDMQMSTPRMNRDEETHLNKLATFDTFVAGDSNRFAHAVALAVAETPGKLYNPLCIYGGPGLGKTHLLNAIGNEALRENPSLKVRYANSEEFTNEFIEALRTSSTDPNGVTNFNRRYRECDILLIDDIQFLRGEETMRQFFHTFNALHQANKQIVIASDVAPKNLKGFEQRLISRFDSGLSVDVRPPDLETRIAILRMKAQTSGMEVPNDVLNLIAEQVTDNVRELEGALTRVHAMASLNKQPLTRALAEQTLQDFFSSNVEITPTDIITATAQYFQLTFDDLVGTSRTKNIAMARQIAMYMAREMTSLSLVDIGEIFGGRDHSTVMHACRKITSEMAEKREVYNYVNELTMLIKRKGSSK
ncbi:MAG: chromosomal replication initiator protein DnaA [Bifidobacteriaceae bacterium]|nr:chromosomal replication initiator protein DnaA [Bifidobacteriaceae bacterium]